MLTGSPRRPGSWKKGLEWARLHWPWASWVAYVEHVIAIVQAAQVHGERLAQVIARADGHGHGLSVAGIGVDIILQGYQIGGLISRADAFLQERFGIGQAPLALGVAGAHVEDVKAGLDRAQVHGEIRFQVGSRHNA